MGCVRESDCACGWAGGKEIVTETGEKFGFGKARVNTINRVISSPMCTVSRKILFISWPTLAKKSFSVNPRNWHQIILYRQTEQLLYAVDRASFAVLLIPRYTT